MHKLFAPLKPLLATHTLYAVGGAVRAIVRGREPGEADFTTPSLPEAILASAAAYGLPTNTQGLKWGSVQVAGQDITTFRTEVYTKGSRHPQVAFTTQLVADAPRRDFTCNAVYLAPDGNVSDPFGGAEDLRQGQVVWICDPLQRLAEDPLRWHRWLRFCAEVGTAALQAPVAHINGNKAPVPFLAVAEAAARGLAQVSAARLAKERAKFGTQPLAEQVREIVRQPIANRPELAHILLP